MHGAEGFSGRSDAAEAKRHGIQMRTAHCPLIYSTSTGVRTLLTL